jgi:hypothetical protein
MQAATRARATNGQKDSRRKMLAVINIQWKELRPDLRHSPDELRAERLAFAADLLKLKGGLGSLGELTDRQLGKVLDRFREMREQPALPDCQVAQPTNGGAEIIHLASPEQVYTINKILLHLGWGEAARKAFISRRYKRENPVHLRPRQAHSLIRILLNIACAAELKERGFRKVTRQQIRLQIPSLKSRLGIDRPQHQEAEQCQDSLISSEERSAT